MWYIFLALAWLMFEKTENTNGYHLLFERVFAIVEKVTGNPVRFRHLHGVGINGVVADMDWAQMQGMWLV